MKPFFAISFVALVAIGSGWGISYVSPIVDPPQKPAGLEAADENASVSLLGQFRTSASAWLWLRTDLYLHNGVEMRPLSDAEKQAGRRGVGTSEAEYAKVLNEDNVITSVPPKSHDFRGFLGDIERLTSAYRDMRKHSHNNPKLALPLFRLMTWIDPGFIAGWTTGAVTIARDHSMEGTDKALGFLREGLKHNPASVEILKELGFLMITRKHDLTGAAGYLEQACKIGASGPSDSHQEDEISLLEAYRWLGLCYRTLGDREELHRSMLAGTKRFPEDVILARLLNPPPSILTETGMREYSRELAERLRAEHGSGEMK